MRKRSDSRLAQAVFSVVLAATVFGVAYLGTQVKGNFVTSENVAQVASKDESFVDQVLCVVGGWFGLSCEVEEVPVFVEQTSNVTPPSVTVSTPVISTTTVVQNITNEYVTRPTEVVREVTIQNGNIDLSRFITREEYDRQIDALLTSIENVSRDDDDNNGGGGGISDITSESIEDLADVASMSQSVGDLFTWNGTAWTNISTSSLGITGGGGSSQWTTTGDDIYYNDGNVGVGTTTPTRLLTIGDNAYFNDGGDLVTRGQLSLSNGLLTSDGVSVAVNSTLFADALDVTGTSTLSGGNFIIYGDGSLESHSRGLSNSFFVGQNAGLGATGAIGSTFIGEGAGIYAPNALSSIFMGSYAGAGAANAAESIFIGDAAGNGAGEGTRSVFVGYGSGNNATNASLATFVGYYSGNGATNASSSSFFGYESGIGAVNAAYSIFIGYQSGISDTVDNTGVASSSIAIGRRAGTGGYSDSIALGHGVINSAARQLNIGNVLYATGLYTSNTQSATPQTNGRIGIGTDSPTAKLTVAPAAAYGPELVTNGTFTGNASGWTLQSSCSEYNSDLVLVTYDASCIGDAGSPSLATNVNLVSGTTYVLTFDITADGDEMYFNLDNDGTSESPFVTGTHEIVFTAGYTGTDTLTFESYNWYEDSSWTIDNVSLRSVTYESTPLLALKNVGGATSTVLGLLNNNVSFGVGALGNIGSSVNMTGIGYNAGNGANSAGNANFFGYNAGAGATGANGSNFLGNSAGAGATSASNSNFLGWYAGFDATDAASSNFLGNNAGYLANNASNSNFLGQSSGFQATNATYSNFFGHSAGRSAINAENSNFLGRQAGYQATNARYSNFFGNMAGYGATAAEYSNFFGLEAGYQAVNATSSVFIGNVAGQLATNAAYSIFIGESAGNIATNADYSTFIGYAAGINDTVNNNISSSSIAIGRYAGTGGYSDSIALGHGVVNSAARQLNIGNVLYATGLLTSDTQTATPQSIGRVGIGTSTPSSVLTVAGDFRLTGGFRDSLNATGTLGQLLWSTGTSTRWVSTSTLGISGGSSLFTENGSTTYLSSTTANFALGTTSTNVKLEVVGDIVSKGTSWTVRSAAGDNDGWKSVTYGNGLFVAVGASGASEVVMYSSDGINWATTTAAGNNDSWTSVTYGNGMFVAVGALGDRVMYSSDGINWATTTAAGNNDSWTGITYGNGLFVAVSAFSVDRVMTSPDGINWTVRSAGGDDDHWYGVTYGNGRFVAVGSFDGDQNAMYSTDGINWTAQLVGSNSYSDVAYGNGLFVAVGGSLGGDRISTSPNGVTWTARTAAGNNDSWTGITYGNGLFVAVSESGDSVITSPDGINWTVRSAAGDNDYWQAVTYGNGLFVAVGGLSSTDRVMTSGKLEETKVAHNNLYQGGLNIMGNIGIGTTTGASKLHVIGTAGNTTALTIASSTGSAMLSIAANGNATFVGSGGTCTINGSGACSSDERLKTNFQALDNESALDNLMTLRVGTYQWADTTWDQSENIGVLAQDLLAVYPQLVGEAPTTFLGETSTYYTVNYAGLTVPIIAAIKELNLKLEDLTLSASSTTFSELEPDSFTKRFFDRLIVWFADTANGIGTMVASVFQASEMICVDDECLTADDIRLLKERNNIVSDEPEEGDVEVIDLCPNLDGEQVEIPDGYVFDVEANECVAGETVIPDEETPVTPPAPILGCTDSEAENYDATATEDDGSCSHHPEAEPGAEPEVPPSA